jgi:hypothetical protein
MSFFDMPPWRLRPHYRAPAWLRPPDGMVPGIVPAEFLVASTETYAVLVTKLLAFPNGLDFAVVVRPRPGRPREPRRRDHRGDFGLQLEIRFADGHVVGNHPRHLPRDFDAKAPGRPMLYQTSGGGCDGVWSFQQWLWRLPPPGPLVFACAWPARQIPVSRVETDAGLVLEAAGRARALWPEG